MPPLIVLVLAALALAALLAVALGRRERSTGVHVAGRGPDVARDALVREVSSLAGELADVEPAARLAAPGDGSAPPRVAGPVAGPVTTPAEGGGLDDGSPASAPGAGDWDVRPAPAAAPPGLAAAYAALSAQLLDEARCTESALARWAADLHLLAPVVAGREDAVVRALGPEALPDRRRAAREAVATDAVGRARYRVATVAPPTRRAAAPVLPSLPERTSLPPEPVAPAPVQHEPPDVLRERARVAIARAQVLLDDDPVAARQLAWEADLAAFDAVLLDAAHRGGDDHLVSVRLRRQLALRLLAAERGPEALAATRPGDVAPAVQRVRVLLRSCLEPHEHGALEATLGSWAGGETPPADDRAPLDRPGPVRA